MKDIQLTGKATEFPVYAKLNNLALKDIIGKAEDERHSRDEVKRYLPTALPVAVPGIPLESIEKSFRERCLPVVTLIARAKE